MRTLLRSFCAYFPRKTSSAYCYRHTLYPGEKVDDTDTEMQPVRDLNNVTESEKKFNAKKRKQLDKRSEMEQRALTIKQNSIASMARRDQEDEPLQKQARSVIHFTI